MKKTAFLFLIAILLGGAAYAGEGCSMSGHKGSAASKGNSAAAADEASSGEAADPADASKAPESESF